MAGRKIDVEYVEKNTEENRQCSMVLWKVQTRGPLSMGFDRYVHQLDSETVERAQR